ncbi:HAMP domain-containing protein [bacterium]|nr:HAMP domain-containing protein [bacterium]
MSLSLQTKFIIIFLALGIFVAGLTSGIFYGVFRHLVEVHLQSELTEEAQVFAELVTTHDGRIELKESNEWLEYEHIKNSEYSRFVTITDITYRTIRKTNNLGVWNFQDYYDFQPVNSTEAVNIDIDSVHVLCVVMPVRENDKTVAYILAASDVHQLSGYVSVLEEAAGYSIIPVVIISFIVAYVLANRVIRPLKKIRKAARGIDWQHLDLRLDTESTEPEIIRLTETLNRLFERLEKSFHQINEFSSNVSHELRTPLTILRGNIEVGLSKDRTAEEYVQILSELQEETLHVINIVDALLLLARADSHKIRIEKEPVDLKHYCQEVKKDWEVLCSLRQQTLTCAVNDLPLLPIDKKLFYQLMLNLVSNASKYSPIGSPIRISVNVNNGKTNQIEIHVNDEGIGIDPDELPRVFERFYRVDKSRSKEFGGSGLGLAICKMIAELHGGSISLLSERNKGTTAKIILPI